MKRMLIPPVVLGLLMFVHANPAVGQSSPFTPETPVVSAAQMPLYPALARQAAIQGIVQVQVTTDGTSTTKVNATGAHKMLLDAAEQNVRSWKFYRHKPQTFVVTFVYKLEPPEVYGFVNSIVLLELPTHVEVRSKLPMMTPTP